MFSFALLANSHIVFSVSYMYMHHRFFFIRRPTRITVHSTSYTKSSFVRKFPNEATF